jgi:C1A family cysteine protease
MKKEIITIGVIGIFLIVSISFYPAASIAVDMNEVEKTRQTTDVDVCQRCTEKIMDPRINENKEAVKHSYFLGALLVSDEYLSKSDPVGEVGYVPPEWDWRDAEINGIKGDWTTPVKYQGWCGSCYAFAALGALEAVISIQENDPTLDLDLSEQYVVSCADWYDTINGCKGGAACYVYDWMMHQGEGAIPEECFPYGAKEISCSEKCEAWERKVIPINGSGSWADAPDDFLKSKLIEKGPLVVQGMEAYEDFDNYTSGVYTHKYGGLIGYHSVVIVGYMDDPNIGSGGYWICKNSWSKNWGENGWFRIAYGECKINRSISYVTYKTGSIPSLMVDAVIDVNRWNPPAPKTMIDFHGVAAGGTKPYSWHWEFSDGYESDDRDPTHSYEKNGYYNVTLTVTDANGSTLSDTDEILIDTSPDKPTIEGSTQGKVGTEYTYNIAAIDPDSDDVKFSIWWKDYDGDKYTTTDFYHSGEKILFSYKWNRRGAYYIKVCAIDEYDIESDWTTLEVSMPRNKALNRPFLQFLQNFFEKYPNAFPILQAILQQSRI